MDTNELWKAMCDEARGRPRCLIVDKDGSEIAAEMFRVIQRLATPGWLGESELQMLIQECRRIVQKVLNG
jgi:hypothetical protein